MKPPGQPIRRSPIRRTAIKRKSPRRAPVDRVDPVLHLYIRRRDGMCFWARVWVGAALHEGWVTDLEARAMGTHDCSNAVGRRHSPMALDELTVDHFWHDGGHMRDRAPSRPEHMVAACWALNDHGMTHVIRQLERAYVAWLAERGRL